MGHVCLKKGVWLAKGGREGGLLVIRATKQGELALEMRAGKLLRAQSQWQHQQAMGTFQNVLVARLRAARSLYWCAEAGLCTRMCCLQGRPSVPGHRARVLTGPHDIYILKFGAYIGRACIVDFLLKTLGQHSSLITRAWS